jgi:hypothetical protein
VKLFDILATTVDSFSNLILSYSELIPELNIWQILGTIGNKFLVKSDSDSECALTFSKSWRIFIYVDLSKKSIMLSESSKMPDLRISLGFSWLTFSQHLMHYSARSTKPMLYSIVSKRACTTPCWTKWFTCDGKMSIRETIHWIAISENWILMSR